MRELAMHMMINYIRVLKWHTYIHQGSVDYVGLLLISLIHNVVLIVRLQLSLANQYLNHIYQQLLQLEHGSNTVTRHEPVT